MQRKQDSGQQKKYTIDDRVERFHGQLMKEKELSMLAGVLKNYDPEYKPAQLHSQIFRETENKFITADNRRIGSLVELAIALQDMPDHVFRQHVNQFKHDFARWAKDEFKSEEFANKLMQKKTKKDMKSFIAASLGEQINLIKR